MAVPNHVNASVVMPRGANAVTRAPSTAVAGEITTPAANSRRPKLHMPVASEMAPKPIVLSAISARYNLPSGVLKSRPPYQRPPTIEPPLHNANIRPPSCGDPFAVVYAGIAISSTPNAPAQRTDVNNTVRRPRLVSG